MMTKEEEILNLVQEECAEVIQIISKVRRFGWGDEAYNNKERLIEELSDVMLATTLLFEFDVLPKDYDKFEVRMRAKRRKLEDWSNIFK